MPLSLNGWPPLVSHVVALLTGVSLANLSAQEQIRDIAANLPRKGDFMVLQVEKNQIQLTENRDDEATRKKTDISERGGNPIQGLRYLVRVGSSDQEDCLLSSKPIEVREADRDRVVIVGQKGQVALLLSLVEIFTLNNPIKVFYEHPKKPLCQPKNLVRYDN